MKQNRFGNEKSIVSRVLRKTFGIFLTGNEFLCITSYETNFWRISDTFIQNKNIRNTNVDCMQSVVPYYSERWSQTIIPSIST